jgi:diamine N-acetyltransferase
MTDDDLEADAGTVAADLARLRRVLESRPVEAVDDDRIPELSLAPVTADTLPQAVAIRVAPEQEPFVAPVVESLAEAYAAPTAWPRLVLDGAAVVGFVMANFDPEEQVEAFRCGIWRLNVDRAAQGRGVGRFAVDAVLEEARRRGQQRVTVLWERGERGPEGFYRRCGFVPTGEELFGEVVAARDV